MYGTTANEKHYETGSYRFNRRHHHEHGYVVWLVS